MKIDIPKFLLFVMMTPATAVAEDSSSTLATTVAIKEEKALLNNEERATTDTATTTPEGFAALSLSTLSSSWSLVEVSGADNLWLGTVLDDTDIKRQLVWDFTLEESIATDTGKIVVDQGLRYCGGHNKGRVRLVRELQSDGSIRGVLQSVGSDNISADAPANTEGTPEELHQPTPAQLCGGKSSANNLLFFIRV